MNTDIPILITLINFFVFQKILEKYLCIENKQIEYLLYIYPLGGLNEQ